LKQLVITSPHYVLFIVVVYNNNTKLKRDVYKEI